MKILNKIIEQDGVLELFNCVVIDPVRNPAPETERTVNFVEGMDTSLMATTGVIADFTISSDLADLFKRKFRPIEIKTLFGRAERETSSTWELVLKQVIHYVEVYGLNSPGLFNLEVTGGTIIPLRYVKGISEDELADKVRKLIYANAPIKDVEVVKLILKNFDISYDINLVANNELRVLLFDEAKHVFADGDDAVRYMCYKATGSTMLIKSREVINAMSAASIGSVSRGPGLNPNFFEAHQVPLSKVFNRHKRLIIAAKTAANKTAINKITRLSKVNHVPIQESVGKRFVALALDGKAGSSALSKIGLRDKFKILNLLEYKMQGQDTDAFVIRNGRIHLETGRAVDTSKIPNVMQMVLHSIADDLAHLKGKTILLDASVDYGLPVSRKQTLGNLPFGTAVTVNGPISAGMYWRDEWGAHDLDLSAIDLMGNRTGWGRSSGYHKSNPIAFSGDVTSAYDGAMEFMTSEKETYGLFVNIYSGNENAGFELVVGTDDKSKDKWISDTVIREKHALIGRGSVIGFVKNQTYIVYAGRLDNQHVSGNKNAAILARASGKIWTVKALFDKLNINYVVDKQTDVCYDYDLNYAGFSYDKLEELLLN